MANDDENGIEYFGKDRRNKTALQGFDSDSEGYGGSDSDEEPSKPSTPKKDESDKENGSEDDDDMFASDKEVEDKQDNHERNLLDEFEKDSGIGRYDADFTSAENADEQEIAAEDEQERQRDYFNNIESLEGDLRKPNKDLQIEAFDLRAEAESGILDKDMNYVPEKVKDEEPDEAWLVDVKTNDIEKARRAQKLREAHIARSQKKSSRTTEDLLKIVIDILEPSETPLECLSRLSPPRAKSKRKKKAEPVSETEKLRKEMVYSITEACDELINDKGLAQLYDLSREELMRAYKEETGSDFVVQRSKKRKASDFDEDVQAQVEEDYGPKIWEFRWNDDESVLGPYSTYEMNSWKESYFNDSIRVRRVGEEVFRSMTADDFDA